jgi:hypothetical protein
MTVRKILIVLACALVGFGIGVGLLFQFSPRAIWFAATAPGLWLFHPFEGPGVSVWMIPIGNGIAYAATATLLIFMIGVAHAQRKTRSI